MSRPLAQRHLERLHELVTSASLCRVLVERELSSEPAVAEAASRDRSIDEEVVSLARSRGWALPERKPYEWKMVLGISDVRPRLRRVLQRDLFELGGIYRDTDDDEVGSVAAELLCVRRSLVRELERADPALALPGAK